MCSLCRSFFRVMPRALACITDNDYVHLWRFEELVPREFTTFTALFRSYFSIDFALLVGCSDFFQSDICAPVPLFIWITLIVGEGEHILIYLLFIVLFPTPIFCLYLHYSINSFHCWIELLFAYWVAILCPVFLSQSTLCFGMLPINIIFLLPKFWYCMLFQNCLLYDILNLGCHFFWISHKFVFFTEVSNESITYFCRSCERRIFIFFFPTVVQSL